MSLLFEEPTVGKQFLIGTNREGNHDDLQGQRPTDGKPERMSEKSCRTMMKCMKNE